MSSKVNREEGYCDVVLPLPLPQLFTYKIPPTYIKNIHVGVRVIVPFGQRKFVTGVVKKIHQNKPAAYQTKEILDVLDTEPTMNSLQFRFMDWMAEYYLCTPGEVLQAALPSGFKLSSESMIQLNPAFKESDFDLTEKEQRVIQELRSRTLSYKDISKLIDSPGVQSIIKSLIQKQAILLFEEVKEKYSPKIVTRIRLNEKFTSNESLSALLDQFEKKPKQQEIILRYLQQVPVLLDAESNRLGIEKSLLLNTNISATSLQTLLKSEIFISFEEIVSRLTFRPDEKKHSVSLSPDQETAKESILRQFDSKDIVLLHGVTGSGKTEIYIDLIKRSIDNGSQALLLLPEIALTTQIVNRLEEYFGDKMGVYHSKFSDNERVEVWKGLQEGRYDFIVGVRSAIFLPFTHLGLVIVDEEHESSYKQQDPAPRYNGRDSALVLARIHSAKTLLGSATPSIESRDAALKNKWGYVSLLKRYANVALPEIVFADMKTERKNKTVQQGFSLKLLTAIRETIANKKQVIIFQNRRGYAPMLECEDCGNIPMCNSCSVSLTYHQFSHELRCHYCGFARKVPNKCDSCSSNRLKTIGAGTERLEDELQLILPEARISRMDLDTTRRKNSFAELITAFSQGEIDILIGTQMVTKGLDFANVELVGVYDADRMLYFPDFRAIERTYQMIVQVSGRAGRKSGMGKVIIQTAQPDHPVFPFIQKNDYDNYFTREVYEREMYLYPPFTRMIHVSVLHLDKKEALKCGEQLAGKLRAKIGSKRILGPQAPSIERLRNYYHIELFIKLERDIKGLQSIKNEIAAIIGSEQNMHMGSKGRIIIDIDPI
ncbi:MAG: replication restart helicase PriA [Cytophaga sp.]|uniref:replication restart helicase PriA n=1 Tax=Cytophaga sp. TaxID=29535 RepID=UPI003F8173A7